MKLWIDDIRMPPDDSWEIARNYEEAMSVIFHPHKMRIEIISLDHDLGEDRSGYDILCAIERQIAKGGWWMPLPEFRIHSANPVGVSNMRRAIDSINRMAEDQGII